MNLATRLLQRALGARLPQTRGTLILPGLHAPITIRRDRFGVPYVDAAEDHDAWFGLGFCQAQDRAFQLELRLRTQRGTLSELFGEETLAIDRLARRIGFREASRRQLAALDAEVLAQIEAFAAGVNAGLTAGSRKVAPEFALLRAAPTLWQPEDVIAQAKLMSFLLIGNWDVELARYKILLGDGPRALQDLDPTPYPEDHPVAAGGPAGAPALDRLAEDLDAFTRFTGAGGGSNAWAVAPSRTASGRPILASDPHLEATLPGHWYLAHVRTPQWGVAGAALIGAPAIGVGHNGHAAWGVTAGLADTVDLFVEDVAEDGRSVRRGDGFEACDLRREVIHVRGRSDVVEDVLVTPRGPVIGPALRGEVGAVSISAVWLQPRPARGFATAHKAHSFDAFRAEFEQWPLLSQNVVYADADGHVGWFLAGEIPRRRKGWGTLPTHAADAETGWHDDGVPFDAMPRVLDPDAGYVASANNQPAQDNPDAPYLGVDWLDGYRAGRIEAALSHRDDWALEATLALQMDEVCLPWREIRDIILGLPAPDEAPRFALRLLSEWDGTVSADSAGAAVYERFLAAMARRIARTCAPASEQWALGRGFTDLAPATTFAAGRTSRLIRHLVEQPVGWFESWPDEMLDALAEVVADLRLTHGPSPEDWRWGTVRPLVLPNPLGRVKAMAPVFNRGPFPWGGDGNTVSQASGSNPAVVASLRFVVEAGDWDSARFVLPGGQSGNPFSPHYDDMLPLWQRGEGVPIAWSQDAIYDASVEALRLEPLNPV